MRQPENANAVAKAGQPEMFTRAPTACWQAVRWQRMIGWLDVWIDWAMG
jgi:hypothetical protein